MKRWLPLIIVVVAIVGLVGWRLAGKKEQEAQLATSSKDRASGPMSVSYAVAGPRELDQTLDAVGTIVSPYPVKISPKIAGVVTYLQVREGDHVKAGQIVAKLDPDTITGTVAANAANVAMAQEKYAQSKLTQNPNTVGVRTGIDQQLAAVNSAVANLNQVTENRNARVAQAQAAVTDGDAKIGSAKAALAGAQANLGSANANLKNAKTKLNRDLDLYKQNYIAAQDVDDQKTAVEVAAAAVDVAQKGVDAADQAVTSATAERNASQNQLDITKKQANADIAVAKAAVQNANATLALAQANRSQIPAYKANLDALKASVRAARGVLNASKMQLSDTDIASPIDGTVTQRTIDPGALAQPGAPMLTIEYLQWVYFNASVPVENAREVAVGQTARVTIDSIPGKTFTGPITQVGQVADPTSHQVVVQVKLENKQLMLRPGMFGHLGILVSRVRADVVVPREAVTKNPDGTATVVLVAPGDIAKTVQVVLGRSDSRGYEVTSGLQPGDKVVSMSFATLTDGRKLNLNGVSEAEGSFRINKVTLPAPSGSGKGESRKAAGASP